MPSMDALRSGRSGRLRWGYVSARIANRQPRAVARAQRRTTVQLGRGLSKMKAHSPQQDNNVATRIAGATSDGRRCPGLSDSSLMPSKSRAK